MERVSEPDGTEPVDRWAGALCRCDLSLNCAKPVDSKGVCETLWPMAQVKNSQGAGGRLAAVDAKIEVPSARAVLAEEVLAVLESFQWPPCHSRTNVRPDGHHVLQAFCLGVVNSYNVGLTSSRLTRILQNLARLVTRFGRNVPSHRFTSVQFNRNYSAKLHCDSNNMGLSLIIGLGDYGEGGLWVMNPPDGRQLLEDDVPMTVTVSTTARLRLSTARCRLSTFESATSVASGVNSMVESHTLPCPTLVVLGCLWCFSAAPAVTKSMTKIATWNRIVQKMLWWRGSLDVFLARNMEGWS